MTVALAAIVVLGTCLAGFVQGLSGFAFGMVAMSVWAWTVEPQLTGPMVVWGSFVGQLLALRSARRGYDGKRALPFVLGGIVGVPFGVLLLQAVDARLFRGIIGLLLVVFCAAMLLARHLPVITRGNRAADGLVGMIGGVMGGLGGLSGVVPTLWCTLRRWDKHAQRATFQIFNLAMATLTLTVYFVSGTLTLAMLPIFGIMLPVAIVPTLVGARLYQRFDELAFKRLVLLLLLASGAMLMVSFLLSAPR